MRLNDTKCRTTKPKDKTFKICDGDGLYLVVNPSGTKVWHFYYSYESRRQTISFGRYPDIGLADARKMRQEARTLLTKGLNPSSVRAAQKRAIGTAANNTFEQVALRWKNVKSTKISPKTMKTAWQRLELYIFPHIGQKQIGAISRQELLGILKKLENQQKLETLNRVLWRCGEIFDHALNEGLIETNPTIRMSKVFTSPEVTHQPCIKSEELPKLLLKIEETAQRQYPQTLAAIKLLMLTFARTEELIGARWEEFDLDNALWVIPSHRTKMRREHYIPLSVQVVEILNHLKDQYPKSPWILPSPNGHQNHVSNNIVLNYLKRMGYKGKMTGHGFRSLAASILTEKLGCNEVAVDRQLAHKEKDKTKAAYFRAEYMEDRKTIMQTWSDYIEEMTPKAGTISDA